MKKRFFFAALTACAMLFAVGCSKDDDDDNNSNDNSRQEQSVPASLAGRWFQTDYQQPSVITMTALTDSTYGFVANGGMLPDEFTGSVTYHKATKTATLTFDAATTNYNQGIRGTLTIKDNKTIHLLVTMGADTPTMDADFAIAEWPETLAGNYTAKLFDQTYTASIDADNNFTYVNGDMTLKGTVSYDAATGKGTATVTEDEQTANLIRNHSYVIEIEAFSKDAFNLYVHSDTELYMDVYFFRNKE